jgi:glycosyltransferase involved in cell wall biosynthesis
MIWFFIFISVCYGILIIALAIGFKSVSEFKTEVTKEKRMFTVIIPFRNEEENLPELLTSIGNLNYPKELVEFLFVDDESTDGSVETIITHFKNSATQYSIILNHRISASPKKDAITTAIKEANSEWIITTDADCILPVNWLKIIDNFIHKNNPNMVVAPVNYMVKKPFLYQFQLLDFMSMQGSTIGGFGINYPFMCNGANLAYRKESFLKLKGFEGNNHLASGDDIFLFEKFLEEDRMKVQFLKSKEAIVSTFPVKSWNELVHQRVRWAAKTGNFKSIRVKLIGLLILLMNASLIISLFAFLSHSISLLYLLIFWIFKLFVDLTLFLPTVTFFNHKKTFLKAYFSSSIFYPFFSVFIILKSILFSYKWKGRRFKK